MDTKVVMYFINVYIYRINIIITIFDLNKQKSQISKRKLRLH